jgi:hypothetical protein
VRYVFVKVVCIAAEAILRAHSDRGGSSRAAESNSSEGDLCELHSGKKEASLLAVVDDATSGARSGPWVGIYAP